MKRIKINIFIMVLLVILLFSTGCKNSTDFKSPNTIGNLEYRLSSELYKGFADDSDTITYTYSNSSQNEPEYIIFISQYFNNKNITKEFTEDDDNYLYAGNYLTEMKESLWSNNNIDGVKLDWIENETEKVLFDTKDGKSYGQAVLIEYSSNIYKFEIHYVESDVAIGIFDQLIKSIKAK